MALTSQEGAAAAYEAEHAEALPSRQCSPAFRSVSLDDDVRSDGKGRVKWAAEAEIALIRGILSATLGDRFPTA